MIFPCMQNGIEDYVHAAKGKGGGRLFQAHFQEAWDRVVRLCLCNKP